MYTIYNETFTNNLNLPNVALLGFYCDIPLYRTFTANCHSIESLLNFFFISFISKGIEKITFVLPIFFTLTSHNIE